MTNVKETYIAYREVEASTAKNMGKLGANAMTNPKTIVESMENFFGLFKVATKEAILNEVDFNQFKRTVEEKNAMPYDPAKPNFDTAQELQVVQKVIADYKAKQKTI